MNGMKLTRRKFIVGTSAIGAGLSLGILPQLSSAAPGMDEVNAWCISRATIRSLFGLPDLKWARAR